MMARYVLLLPILLGTSVLADLPEDLAEPEIIVNDIAPQFTNSRTRAQRDHAWEDVRDKPAGVVGRVHDIKPDGIILPARIEISLSEDVTATCFLRAGQIERVIEVNIGETIGCVGSLEDYTLIFGLLSFVISDGLPFTKEDIDKLQ